MSDTTPSTTTDEPVEGVLLESSTTRPWNDVSPKVTFGALGAAVGAIVTWSIEAAASIDIPTTVEAAIVVVLTFAAGYLVPDNR